MSRIAPNFGRTVYSEPVTVADDENVPDNVAGLRFDASMLIVVSTVIAFWAPPIGLGGIVAGLLYLLASKPAVTTTERMDASIERKSRAGGCFWLLVTCAIGFVAFLLGLGFLVTVAEAGRL